MKIFASTSDPYTAFGLRMTDSREHLDLLEGIRKALEYKELSKEGAFDSLAVSKAIERAERELECDETKEARAYEESLKRVPPVLNRTASEPTRGAERLAKYLMVSPREAADILRGLQIQHIESSIERRKAYSRWILWLTVVWLFLVLATVAASGVRWIELSDTVLTALIGSTTADVIGLLYIVVKHVFPHERGSPADAG